MWLSILGLEKVTDNTKQKKKTDNRTENKDYWSLEMIPYVGVWERVHKVG